MRLQRVRVAIPRRIIEKRKQRGCIAPGEQPADERPGLAVEDPLAANVHWVKFEGQQLPHGPGLTAGESREEISFVATLDVGAIELNRESLIGPTRGRALCEPVSEHDMHEFVAECCWD